MNILLNLQNLSTNLQLSLTLQEILLIVLSSLVEEFENVQYVWIAVNGVLVLLLRHHLVVVVVDFVEDILNQQIELLLHVLS